MKAVITGSSGFIAARLKKYLYEKKFEVAEVNADMGQGGILDYGRLLKIMKDADVVFHMGCISGSKYFDDMKFATRVNCEGTANVLEACRLLDINRIIFSSTSSAYAFTPVPHSELNTPTCTNFYVATKLYGERLMHLFYELYGIKTTIFRYASVYGVGEEKKGSVANPVSQFLWSMLKDEQPILYGKGEQKRDLIFADDVALANIHAIEYCKPDEIYNVGSGDPISFNEVVDMINNLLNKNIEPNYIPFPDNKYQKNYLQEQWLDCRKLKNTGWKQEYPLEDGLNKLINIKRFNKKVDDYIDDR